VSRRCACNSIIWLSKEASNFAYLNAADTEQVLGGKDLGLCFQYLAEINKPHLPNKVKEPNIAKDVLLNSECVLNLLEWSYKT